MSIYDEFHMEREHRNHVHCSKGARVSVMMHEDLVRGPRHHPSLAGLKVAHLEMERPS